jgi:hypothetical protein
MSRRRGTCQQIDDKIAVFSESVAVARINSHYSNDLARISFFWNIPVKSAL